MKAIGKAEELSEKTCEDCGGDAVLKLVDHWYSVWCDECRKSRKKRQEREMELREMMWERKEMMWGRKGRAEREMELRQMLIDECGEF